MALQIGLDEVIGDDLGLALGAAGAAKTRRVARSARGIDQQHHPLRVPVAARRSAADGPDRRDDLDLGREEGELLERQLERPVVGWASTSA